MMSFSPRGVARHSEQLCSVMTQRDSVPARVRRARVPRDTNTTAARFEGVDISTDGQPGPEETRWVFLPKTQEWFSHDADGNLLTDGKWVYTWDGENRLIAMETSSSLPSTLAPARLEFVYDYMSRRCVKRLFEKIGQVAVPATGSPVVEGSTAGVVQPSEVGAAPGGGIVPAPVSWTLKSTYKFVWDGWNLLAELDGNDAVIRTCAWGLDLSGSEQGAGGVGGLLFQHLANTTAVHHLFYDGNGNVTTRGGRQDVPGILCHFTHGLRATPACMGVRTGFERAHKSPSRLVWHPPLFSASIGVVCMKTPGAYVVSTIGFASVALATFCLVLELYPINFQDHQLPIVLVMFCGLAAIVLLILHLLLSIVVRWRLRTTPWIVVAWMIILWAFWELS
jgi:hypothetical protein